MNIILSIMNCRSNKSLPKLKFKDQKIFVNSDTFIIIIFFLKLSFITLMLTSCQSSVNNSENIVFPDSLVSYTKHVQPFMRTTCATNNCHDSYTRAASRDMSEYFQLIGAENLGLILPGNPDQSDIVRILEESRPHHLNSPDALYVIGRINDNQKKGIRQWIKEGALNN